MNSLLPFFQNPGRPLVLGHRGSLLKENFPENSIPAFREALELGADGIELDVRLSKEGEVVVCHDRNLKRLCGVERNLDKLKISEIKELELISDKKFQVRIPLLAEVFEIFGSDLVYNIEIKKKWTSYRILVKKLNSLIRDFHLQDVVWISCFDLLFLGWWRKINKNIPTAFLIENWNLLTVWLSERSFIDVIHPDIRLLPQIINRPPDSKYLCFWTVNNRPDLEKVKNIAGVFAIITDDVKLARNFFPFS